MMMGQGYFITGTDTNVGKTWVTVSLIEYFKNQGKSVIALKPVASGCHFENGRWLNADALLLQQHATVKLDYALVNPYAYEAAISPHLAGKNNPVELDIVVDVFEKVKHQGQIVLVEGAGGWYSPLSSINKNSDLAKKLGLPVLMVVSVKLGCINHALLTHQAILADGVACAGWVAVCNVAETSMQEDVITTLTSYLPVPLLGVLPYMEHPDFQKLARSLDLI